MEIEISSYETFLVERKRKKERKKRWKKESPSPVEVQLIENKTKDYTFADMNFIGAYKSNQFWDFFFFCPFNFLITTKCNKNKYQLYK